MSVTIETYQRIAEVSLPYRLHTVARFPDVPARMPLGWLQAVPFAPAPAPDGTATDRVFWVDADARAWMMRLADVSDTARDRCIREAVASAVMNAAGLPCVPVYLAEIAGVRGAVRPLVRSYGSLGFDSWMFGAAENKAAARMKVSAWLLGIPSLSPADVMIAEDGNIVPIDLSSAFTVANTGGVISDYADRALWDVAAVHPADVSATVDAFESVTEEQWDDVLAPLANSWHPEMTTDFQERLASLRGHFS